MSDSVLTVLKFALLALLYLFFLRVLRSVWAELKEPKARTVAPAGPARYAGPASKMAPPPVPAGAAAISGAAASAAAASAAPGASAPGAPATGGPPPLGAGPGPQLVIIEPAEAKGRAFPLGATGTELTVGRGGGCGVALADDTFVSQLHARIFHAEGSWFVEDLGSTNGTFLNRQKVSGPQSLRKGDRLQVGRTVLEVAG